MIMKTETIEINGRTYVRNAKAVIEGLFSPGKTPHGVFKAGKRGITFYEMDGKTPRVYLCASKQSVQFFVSCHLTSEGRARYMNGIGGLDAEWLGLSEFLGTPKMYALASDIWGPFETRAPLSL